MEEEKQNNNVIKKAGNALKEKAGNRVKKFIKKVVMAIVAGILKVVLPIILALLIFNFLADWFDEHLGKNSKESQKSTVSYSYTTTTSSSGSSSSGSSISGTSTANGGKSGTVNIKLAPTRSSYITYMGTGTETEDELTEINAAVDYANSVLNGAYLLTYDFTDENGNLYTDEEALETIKNDLLSENTDLNMREFSDSELKIIGCLMYNGLEVDKYDEEELKAFALFFKAEIASQNFDLRSADKIGEEVDAEEMANSDYVYGTLQMHRTKASEGVDSETPLEYIPYGDETTPGTFCYMEANNDVDLLNYFSIDEEGRAVFAKYSSVSTTYVYKDANDNEMSESEILENIPEENIFENEANTYISITPFKYKQYIKRYTVNYGLLSDLMIITDNVEFCTEIAKLAFNGKLVINVLENYSTTVSTKETTYTQSKLIYDYVTYDVTGQKENQTLVQGSRLMFIIGSLDNESNVDNKKKLEETYGWSSSMHYSVVNGNSSGGTTRYEWTHEGKTYRLDHFSGTSYQTWYLYEMNTNTTYTDLATRSGTNELINIYDKHISVNYEYREEFEEANEEDEYGYAIDEDYTKDETYIYTIEMTSYTESRPCSYEISEVDSWYIKYKKEYNAPEPISRESFEEKNYEGQYSEEKEDVLTTIDANEIANEISTKQEIQEFITLQENKYKNDYSAVNVQCNITKLEIKQRVKEDENIVFSSSTSGYKFVEEDDEDVDSTKAQLKNVEYIGEQPTFTKEDGEIGFLYIYDEYANKDIDIFLDEDAEDRLFDMLEDDTTTSQYSNIIKFLLYVYDGKDRGVTSLSIKIIDIEAMNKVRGSSTRNYIMAWENGGLWKYETGQSSILPTGYLSEDEAFYIVYEDNSKGHNNIAYGIATFIESDTHQNRVHHQEYGWGYYNWTSLSNEGIDVKTLSTGAYVDKDIIDSYFVNTVLRNFIDYVDDYLDDRLPDYSFSKAQKNALIAVSYQYGNINGFDDIYLSALNEDGTIDAEKMREWSRFSYDKEIGDRKYANWLLFTEETYIDYEGNIMDLSNGSIVESAYEVADHFMNSGVDCHYAGNDVEIAKDNGRVCVYSNIEGAWDYPIENPERYGVVCATFVGLAIWNAELIDTETMNKYGYNWTGGIDELLKDPEYVDQWEVIPTYDELEEGDIVQMSGHVYIYLGDDMAIDQGYCVISSGGSDNRGALVNINYNPSYRTTFRIGYRYIG